MSTLSTAGREKAQSEAQYALAPTAADPGVEALTTSQRFEIGSAGDEFVASASAAYHMIAGDSTVVADTTHPLFPAGVLRFALPDGCTHVAMIESAAGAASGQAYKG